MPPHYTHIGNISDLFSSFILISRNWGQLIIKSSDLNNITIKGALIARDFFSAGYSELTIFDLKCRNMYVAKRIEFKQELQDLIVDWFITERKSAEKIGLKSILV
jgi:hypothetical protein